MKTISELMPLATLGDLKTFCVDYAKKNAKFKKELTEFLNEIVLDDEGSAYSFIERLEDAFAEEENIGGRWDSYYVTDWNHVVSEADMVLEDARKLLSVGNATAALQIAIRMFELTNGEDLSYVDYEDCYLSDTLDGYARLLVDSIGCDSVPQEDKDDVVGSLRKMVKSDIHSFDYCDMNKLLMEATAAALSDEAALKMLDGMIADTSTSGHNRSKYVIRKVELLEKMGCDQKAKDTIRQHIRLHDVRKFEVERCMQRKDFDTALALVMEGRKIAEEEDLRGIAFDWKKQELEVYRQNGDLEQRTRLCKELFIKEGGTMEYYHELKSIVPHDEWKAFLREMLSQTHMRTYFSSSIENDIYIEEQDWESLFSQLMTEEHHTLDMYDKYAYRLKDTHSPALVKEYIKMLKDYAARNMGAKHYDRIKESMKSLQRLKGGRQAAHDLAEFFRATYRRRPSFMAEISNF